MRRLIEGGRHKGFWEGVAVAGVRNTPGNDRWGQTRAMALVLGLGAGLNLGGFALLRLERGLARGLWHHDGVRACAHSLIRSPCRAIRGLAKRIRFANCLCILAACCGGQICLTFEFGDSGKPSSRRASTAGPGVCQSRPLPCPVVTQVARAEEKQTSPRTTVHCVTRYSGQFRIALLL